MDNTSEAGRGVRFLCVALGAAMLPGGLMESFLLPAMGLNEPAFFWTGLIQSAVCLGLIGSFFMKLPKRRYVIILLSGFLLILCNGCVALWYLWPLI
jgi:hypothetical protein